MITRLLALVTLLFMASGGAWYLLRDTPQKRILRWREEAKNFLERNQDFEKAEQLTDQILKIIPTSAYDLVFKATINERRGTVRSLKDALEIYEKVLGSGDTNVLVVAILKARVCRSLGLIMEAHGTLLSVVDVYPFEALMEIAESSLAGLAPGDAYQYFTKAQEVASSKMDQARAEEGLANALLLLISMNSADNLVGGGAPTRTPEERARLLDALKSSSRKALNEALEFVRSDDLPATKEEAGHRLVWATLLIEKLASVKETDTTPYSDGLVLVDLQRGNFGLKDKEKPALLVRLGALRLLALEHERPKDPGAAASLQKDAERDFVKALGKTPLEAREMLDEPEKEVPAARSVDSKGAGSSPRASKQAEEDPVDNYLQSLLAITRVCLGTSQFKRILADDSDLALAQRVTDVIESGHPTAAGLLTLLRGLAVVKAGDAAEGERSIDAYLAGLAPDLRPKGVLDIAEHSLALFPSEPFCFKQLDKFEVNGGGVLDNVGKRVALLLAARGRATLFAEASRRLDETLKLASEAAQNIADCLGVSKILYSIKGKSAAASFLQQVSRRFPNDPEVQRSYADLQYEKANDAAIDRAERDAASREALAAYLFLFVKAPGDSQEIIRRCVGIIRRAEESRADTGLERSLRKFFPTASERVFETFTASLRMFLLGQFGPALDRVTSINAGDLEQFRPFSNFLKGSCHIGLSTYLMRDAARATSESAKEGLDKQYKAHIQSALEEFLKEPESIACKFESANLKFQAVPPKEDVPDDLLKDILAISEAEGSEHSGYFLLARALHHRFLFRYPQKSVKNSELLRILGRQQRALRAAIRKSPAFNPAYVSLAETFLVTDRPDRSIGESINRDLFAPSFSKAISVLKAAPTPDEAVLTRLAQCYEATGQIDLAVIHLEQLAMMRPAPEVFSRLITGYLKSKSAAVRIFLDVETPQEDSQILKDIPKERLPLLFTLRKSFEQLPEHEGQRHMFLAMEAERDAMQAETESAKVRANEVMLSEYLNALEGFDSKRVGVPLVLFNNLAWHLAEDSDPDRKARSMEIAERLKHVSPERAVAPDAHDTYAWVLYKNGRHTEAEDELRGLLKVVDQPLYHYHLARVLLAMKKFDEALKEVQVAQESARPFAEASAARDLEYEIREARRKIVGE